MVECLDLIPSARQEIVRHALAEAFGAGRMAARFRRLKGGVSGALICRVDIGERCYVLRVEPERTAVHHRRRGFACMTIAAAAGVAPAVHYADPVGGVAIMDFVDPRPLSEHPGNTAGLVRELGGLVNRLQSTPTFVPLDQPGDIVATVLATLDRSGLLARGLLDGHRENLARIRAAIPWTPCGLVSSHNDPNPRNLIFDGRRLWLIDWELAACNDPLFDLAIVTFELAATEDLAKVLCVAAGRTPSRSFLARLAVTRLLARLFYGGIALEALAAGPGAAPEHTIDGLTPAEFHRAVLEGRLAVDGPDIARAFGMMSLATFMRGVSEPGFDEVLAWARDAEAP